MGEEKTLHIRALQKKDAAPLAQAFVGYGGDKGKDKFLSLFEEQKLKIRSIWVAQREKIYVGYVTVIWNSELPDFKTGCVPEISDLNVLPRFRGQGIARALLHEAERYVYSRSSAIGIGVGLTKEYGAAQKLYVKCGYVPLGIGLTYKYQSVNHGDQAVVDDDLVFWLIKQRC